MIVDDGVTIPEHTGSRSTRILGAVALLGAVVLVLFGLVVSPADTTGLPPQQEAVRIMYLHVPVASFMYISFFVTIAASAMWLWKKSRWWDTLAAAAGEIGVVFTALCLVTGMLWGRPVWGVYWTWDARLTTTMLLFLLFLGYLAVRRLPADTQVRNRRAAWVALLAGVDLPVVHFSVQWWRGLHQGSTISRIAPEIDGTKLFTLALGFAVCTVVFTWLLVHRFRVAWLEDESEETGLESAIAARRAEAVVMPS